ncbi:three component ABC system middle component [Hymenobacter arcticus]
MLAPWPQRPIEVANLLNPAFCALLLHQVVKAHEQEVGRGLGYPVAFVALPTVLHKDIREQLPPTIATKLHAWLQTHEQVRVRMPSHVQQMAQLTREGLLFALGHEVLALNKQGALVVGARKLGALQVDKGSETAQCVKKAEFIGRWFASVANPIAMLALWGIKLQ